jgi:hypothetical protein
VGCERQTAGGLEAGHCSVVPDLGADGSIPTCDAPDLSGADCVRHGAQGLRLPAASQSEAPELATVAKGVRRGEEGRRGSGSPTAAQPATASSSHATRAAAKGVAEWGAVAKGVASSVTAAMVGTKAGESERSGEGNNEGVAGVDLLHARWERRERGTGRREEAQGRGGSEIGFWDLLYKANTILAIHLLMNGLKRLGCLG